MSRDARMSKPSLLREQVTFQNLKDCEAAHKALLEENRTLQSKLFAPPIEPVGVREALETALITMRNYYAQAISRAEVERVIEQAQAALAAAPVPVVEEVMECGSSYAPNSLDPNIVTCRSGAYNSITFEADGITIGDRVRVVVWTTEAQGGV